MPGMTPDCICHNDVGPHPQCPYPHKDVAEHVPAHPLMFHKVLGAVAALHQVRTPGTSWRDAVAWARKTLEDCRPLV